jgi:Mn-dependent DtxR family transcriptional regulator
VRTIALAMLDKGVASPRQVSEELEAPLQNVSYHVRDLAKLGLIKLVRTTQRRGAIEHRYQAVLAPTSPTKPGASCLRLSATA